MPYKSNVSETLAMRILLSAFAFSPARGGEAAVGWNIANELAKLHDVTVLCGDVRGSERTRLELEKHYGEDGNQCSKTLHVKYVAPTRFIAFVERLHRIPGLWGFYYLAYNLWQRKAYRCAKELHAACPFDIAHQLNMIGYREPGYLWKLPIPFVWGPVGGGPNEPIAFHNMFSWSGCVKVFLRTMLNELQKRFCFRARKAAMMAQKIWAVTDADYSMINDIWGGECEKMVETGTVLREEGQVRKWDGASQLRIVWSGIHTSRKALPILLYALARLGQKDIHVDILGIGPETCSWRSLAKSLGVDGLLTWHGQVSHDEALKVMASGHVFTFPSLKEGTPHVVLEALSLGLPVICHDACGMGNVVTKKCGFKMPLKDPETSIIGFADALNLIIRSPMLISEKSTAALARAKELTWAAKARLISNAYEKVKGE
jgi:glycosyltransferase involved in cell wall biosynthesis